MSLESDPFEYRVTKSGDVLVSRGGQVVTTVRGGRARRLIGDLGADDERDQQLLARVTGNYKRGNERSPNARP